MFRRYGGQPFKRVVPQPLTCEGIKTKYFTVTGGKNRLVLQDDIDKIRAFEMCRPNLFACATIQRNDRSFDADEYQV